MSTTVVVAGESVTVANGFPRLATQVKVGCLEEMNAGAVIAFTTVFAYKLQIGNRVDQEGLYTRSLSSELLKDSTRWLVGIIRAIVIHGSADAVEHRISIVSDFIVHVLTPSTGKSRFVVQQPCQLAA